MENLDGLFVVPDEVVVHFNPPCLLGFDNNIADFEEEFVNCTILVVEDLGLLVAARTLVCLQNDQELSDQLLALAD